MPISIQSLILNNLSALSISKIQMASYKIKDPTWIYFRIILPLDYNSRNGLKVLSLVVPMPSVGPMFPSHCLHIVPVIPMLSPHCPHHHHIVSMVPYGHHVIFMVCVVPTLSPSSPCCSNHKPSINLSINPPIGGGVSTNHKASNRIELSRLGQDLFDIFSDLT